MTESIEIIKDKSWPSVLIIDDDPAEQFLLQKGFKKYLEENQILTAFDGQEALSLLEQAGEHQGLPPDLIVCDINMPRIDGLEFLKCFKKTSHADSCYFVLWSTSERSSERKQALELSVDEYSIKPSDITVLFDMINRWTAKMKEG